MIGNAASVDPDASAQGRIVVFESEAMKPVPGDMKVVQGRLHGGLVTVATTRVSVDLARSGAGAPSFDPAISPDGRWMDCPAQAANLVPADQYGATSEDIPARLRTGTPTLATVSTGGQQAIFESGPPTVSVVVFHSEATNLASDPHGPIPAARARRRCRSDPAQQPGSGAVRLHRVEHEPRHLATAPSSPGDSAVGREPGKGRRLQTGLSASGWKVAFHGGFTHPVAGDVNPLLDVLWRDLSPGMTRIGSVGAAGLGDGASRASNAPNGRWVAFQSSAPNLVPGDVAEVDDVFVRDVASGVLARVSENSSREANADSALPSVSLTAGRVAVVYESRATDLVAREFNQAHDVLPSRP